MIEPIAKHKGTSSVLARCDDCRAELEITCDYERSAGNVWKPRTGQANKKLLAQGWAVLKGKHICPDCVAKQKERQKMEEAPEKVAAPNEPTRQQKRQIMEMLDEVYDTEAEHYIGNDTDETVADVLGVMPGWITKIREEFFGLNGGNEEVESADAQIAELEAAIADDLKAARAVAKRLEEHAEKLSEIKDQVAKIKKAVGPRKLAVAGLK